MYWKLNVYQPYLLITILYVVPVDFVTDAAADNGVCVSVRTLYDIADDHSVAITGGASLLCTPLLKCYRQSYDFDDIKFEFARFWESFTLGSAFCFVWYSLMGSRETAGDTAKLGTATTNQNGYYKSFVTIYY